MDLSRHRLDLFISHVEKADNDCWNWTAYINTGGYGMFGLENAKTILAHRWMYAYMYGNLTPGKFIDHLCSNRRCVNPDHLEEVTRQENIKRASERQKCCKHGHLYDKANTILNKRGIRRCRICKMSGYDAYNEERKLRRRVLICIEALKSVMEEISNGTNYSRRIW